MQLVNTILQEVDDNRTLIDQGKLTPVLVVLANAANVVTYQKDGTTILIATTTGSQLKEIVRQLSSQEFTSMLSVIAKASPAPQNAPQAAPIVAPVPLGQPGPLTAPILEPPEVQEERQFRIWIRKAAVLALLPIPAMLLGAMIALAYKKGETPDSAVVSAFMTTATEMLKVLFSITN
jgi:hypothetical protein